MNFTNPFRNGIIYSAAQVTFIYDATRCVSRTAASLLLLLLLPKPNIDLIALGPHKEASRTLKILRWKCRWELISLYIAFRASYYSIFASIIIVSQFFFSPSPSTPFSPSRPPGELWKFMAA